MRKKPYIIVGALVIIIFAALEISDLVLTPEPPEMDGQLWMSQIPVESELLVQNWLYGTNQIAEQFHLGIDGSVKQVDENYIYAGRTLGLSEWTIFRKVVIPVAGPGIASGTILTFARALGEYGATSMLAGNILGKTRTMAVAIAAEVSAQNYDVAGFWVIVLVTIAFVFIFAINIITMHGISKIQRW